MALAGLATIGGMLLVARGGDLVRGPAAQPNSEAAAPVVRSDGGARFVTTIAPAELIIPDTIPPDGPVRVLWFQGRGTNWTPDGDVVLDGSGEPIRLDEHLRAERLHFWLEGRQPSSVAWDGDDGFWVSTFEGSVLRVAWHGGIEDSVPHPYDYSILSSDQNGSVWASRSPVQFAFPWRPHEEPAPLVTRIGHYVPTAVAARRPRVALFEHLVNAGRTAVAPDGSIFFAPFIREEIVKYSAAGDTLWVASRGLGHGVEHPSFEVIDGEPQLDYAPVNLGLSIGPDRLLYVLSTPGHTTARSRIDAIEPETGVVMRTVELDEPLPTVAVDESGRFYLLDPFWLLTGVAPLEREAFAPFELERLGGGTLRLEAFRGKVVLVNFWASWCAPCRVEMPALDSLAKTFPAEAFSFVALSDDVQPSRADAFIAEYEFEFPVGYGRGRLQPAYHYFGLPYTVLLDREGRVVEEWTGFAGERQLRAIASTIQAELERTGAAAEDEHGHGGPRAPLVDPVTEPIPRPTMKAHSGH
jgi:thiol-disulfide isomerase/thioredoxin